MVTTTFTYVALYRKQSFTSKYAASLLGMCKPDVRLPLVQIKDETKKSFRSS